ncbi:MAG: N-acetyltransferase [Pedosphaera sp.]|nr:N-acetyltransferase [Pedosphaera sp.]
MMESKWTAVQTNAVQTGDFHCGVPTSQNVIHHVQVVTSELMSTTHIQTKNLRLIPQTRDDARKQIELMQPHERAQVSAAWLALLEGSSPCDPWIHGFKLVHQTTGYVIGTCGFTGPPGTDGVVEIAYGVALEHQGKGYATEAAAALVGYAFSNGQVRLIRAHTLPESNASARVLTKCGFHRVGEVIDPEDGLVWRWERTNGTVNKSVMPLTEARPASDGTPARN